MNIQTKKLELVQLILNTKKPSILQKVEEIFKKEKEADWWEELSEPEHKAIEQGLSEADKGYLIPHQEVMNEIRAKYNID